MTRRTMPRRTLRRTERGYILATSALALVPLLVISGMAIDYGGMYWQGSRMQRAVDAAALAGVTWLPDISKAQSVALEVMAKNGWTSGGGNVVTVSKAGLRRLKVSLTAPADRYLASNILNLSPTISRSSTAAYLQPISMGSPVATLGNDPDSAATPQIWLNQSGDGSTKGNGDRFSSGVCGTSNSGFNSGCTGSDNDDYEGGYAYVTNVRSLGTGPLHIQAFDPAFVYTGDTCTDNAWDASKQVTLTAQYSSAPVSDPDAAERYKYSNKAYCPGDQRINGRANLTTTFIVRAPDDTPADISDNPAVCAVSFSPRDDDYFNLLDQTRPGWNSPSGLEGMPFWRVFRRWVDVCTISSPVLGEYITQVTTTADQSNPHFSTTGSLSPATGAGSLENADPSIHTGGHNRYSLRSGFGASVSGTGVSVYARARLPLYVNQNSSSATFYLAQLQPQYAGSTLQLDFFDIADTAGTASMTVLPPSDSNYASFPSCSFTRDGSPPNSIGSSGCSISGLTSGSYDSRVVTLSLSIPTNYTCADTVSTGCWARVSLNFTGPPTDTTTWSAALLGDPVRLVE